MFLAMPSPMQIYAGLVRGKMAEDTPCPITVREGRRWLSQILEDHDIKQIKAEPSGSHPQLRSQRFSGKDASPAIELRDVWFRYERNEPDVVKDLSMKVFPGQFYCIVGGNGTGKTTALSLISGLHKPYRGKISLFGREIGKIRKEEC